MNYQQFKKKLEESSISRSFGLNPTLSPLASDNAVDDVDTSLHNLDEKSLNLLNAFLRGGGIPKVSINPENTVNHIRRKLLAIGLQFSDKPVKETNSGSTIVKDYSLSYLGGRYGVLDNNHNIGFDDNIKHRIGKSLKLKIEFMTQNTGLTTVIPSIVPANN